MARVCTRWVFGDKLEGLWVTWHTWARYIYAIFLSILFSCSYPNKKINEQAGKLPSHMFWKCFCYWHNTVLITKLTCTFILRLKSENQCFYAFLHCVLITPSLIFIFHILELIFTNFTNLSLRIPLTLSDLDIYCSTSKQTGITTLA